MSRRDYRKCPYFEKHPDYGTYYAHYRDAQGTRQRRSLKTKDQVVAASQFTKLLKDVDRGVLGFNRIPRKLTLRDAALSYLDQGVSHLSPASVDRHQRSLKKQVLPHFKGAQLSGVTAKKVMRYIRKRENDSAAPNTIHKELAALSAVFNFAVEEEWVAANAVLAVPRRRKPKLKVVNVQYVPTKEEIFAILDNLFVGARRFFLALCLTGCRLSEVTNTNVSDADLQRGMLRVKRKGGETELIPINAKLREVIEDELASREDVSPADPLFVNSWGRRYKTIRKPLATACDRAGVPRVGHHSLRKAYATILFEAGERLENVSKLLGHKSVSTTEKIYVQWRRETLRDVSEKLGNILAGSGKSQIRTAPDHAK